MRNLKAAIISGKIRRHLGNSNLGKSYVLTLTEKASLTKRFLKEMKRDQVISLCKESLPRILSKCFEEPVHSTQNRGEDSFTCLYTVMATTEGLELMVEEQRATETRKKSPTLSYCVNLWCAQCLESRM